MPVSSTLLRTISMDWFKAESFISIKPYFEKNILPHLSSGKNVLIVAHGNSLRATMIQVGLYKEDEISKIELPTGSPFVISYETKILKNSKYLI